MVQVQAWGSNIWAGTSVRCTHELFQSEPKSTSAAMNSSMLIAMLLGTHLFWRFRLCITQDFSIFTQNTFCFLSFYGVGILSAFFILSSFYCFSKAVTCRYYSTGPSQLQFPPGTESCAMQVARLQSDGSSNPPFGFPHPNAFLDNKKQISLTWVCHNTNACEHCITTAGKQLSSSRSRCVKPSSSCINWDSHGPQRIILLTEVQSEVGKQTIVFMYILLNQMWILQNISVICWRSHKGTAWDFMR